MFMLAGRGDLVRWTASNGENCSSERRDYQPPTLSSRKAETTTEKSGGGGLLIPTLGNELAVLQEQVDRGQHRWQRGWSLLKHRHSTHNSERERFPAPACQYALRSN